MQPHRVPLPELPSCARGDSVSLARRYRPRCAGGSALSERLSTLEWRCSSRRSETSRIRPGAHSVGIDRLWRDLGYALGALLAGVTADAFGLPAAMWIVAGLTFASGLVVAARMTETSRKRADLPS